MKILILTCNTGEGHNSSCAAIKEACALRGIHCDSLDSLSLVSKNVSEFISKSHKRIYRYMPSMFAKGYRFTEKHENVFAKKTLIYRCLALGVPKLRNIVLQGGYDHIICVHVFPALMVTELRERYKVNISASFVATDYTCSPSVSISDLDWYFIPHGELIGEFARKGVPAQKLIPTGIPVRRDFSAPLSKAEAKERLDLARFNKTVLLMCGSMGCGPVEGLARRFSEELPDDSRLIVVCGNNKKLYQSLLSARLPKVRVVGYTTEMPVYMSAVDLFLTKPGGISITEAASKRLPMVLMDIVGGCETRNIDFFRKMGWAKTAENRDEMADIALRILKEGPDLSDIARNIEENFLADSADRIVDFLEANLPVTLSAAAQA